MEFDKLLESAKAAEFELSYSAFGKSVEKHFFWVKQYLGPSGKLKYKFIDFTEKKAASVFSAVFGEMTSRKQFIENRIMDMLAKLNTVVKSVAMIVYEMKELDRRLKIFKDLDEGGAKADSAFLMLKRIWMDEVDIKKGRGSINALSTGALEFVTLRDAFMAVPRTDKEEALKWADKQDLNDRVKRILKERVNEFFDWYPLWKKDLTARRKMLLAYLKTQYETVKLYLSWLRPYMEAVRNLHLDVGASPADLVHAFDMMKITLDIWAHDDINVGAFRIVRPKGSPPILLTKTGVKYKSDSKKVKERIIMGEKAEKVINVKMVMSLKPILVDMKGGRSGVYRYTGSVNVKITAYGFLEKEYEEFEKQLKEKQESEEFKAIEDITKSSLDAIKEDLMEYINEFEGKNKDKKSNNEESQESPSMFRDIIKSFASDFKFKREKGSGEQSVNVPLFARRDYTYSKDVVKLAAKEDAKDLYTTFKKTLGMPAP